MPPVAGPSGPRDAATEGPPSERARAALSERLRHEVADARMRFEEAGLRAEAHRLLGQHEAAADVIDEQERILAEVQDRLGRAVSAAVVERDAEQVLADLVATERILPLSAPTLAEPAPSAPQRPRTPALAGVASVVAMLGLAVAATLGLTRGLDGVEVTEAAADSTPADLASDDDPEATVGPGPSLSPRPGGVDSAPATIGPPVVPTIDAAAPLAGPTSEEDEADPTESPAPEPTPDPELGTVVQELIDAVAGLDEPDDPSEDDGTPEEFDASVPGVDEVVDQLDGDGSGDTDGSGATGDDGFVPGAGAE